VVLASGLFPTLPVGNERRVRGYDPRLLRPMMTSRLIGLMLKWMKA
jgi:hypothetical protein